MDILFSTAFLDRLIPENVPTERKVVVWNLEPVAIAARKPQNKKVNEGESGTAKKMDFEQVVDDAEEISIVRVVHQVV